MSRPNISGPEYLSEDIADLFAIYKNIRASLVALTAAGPLMETRHTVSKKLETDERVSHQEASRVSEQIRMLFKLRAILIDAGLPLELPGDQPARAPRSTEAAAEQPAQPAEPAAGAAGFAATGSTPETSAPFNPGLKSTRAPGYDPPFIPRELLRGRSASTAAG